MKWCNTVVSLESASIWNNFPQQKVCAEWNHGAAEDNSRHPETSKTSFCGFVFVQEPAQSAR